MNATTALARISKQSLYREYPSKAALYAAVVRDWVERGYDAIRPHANRRSALAAGDRNLSAAPWVALG